MDKYTVDLDKVLNDFEYSELTEHAEQQQPAAAQAHPDSLGRNGAVKHSINNVFSSLNEYLSTEIAPYACEDRDSTEPDVKLPRDDYQEPQLNNGRRLSKNEQHAIKNEQFAIDNRVAIKNEQFTIDNRVTIKNEPFTINNRVAIKNEQFVIDNKVANKNSAEQSAADSSVVLNTPFSEDSDAKAADEAPKAVGFESAIDVDDDELNRYLDDLESELERESFASDDEGATSSSINQRMPAQKSPGDDSLPTYPDDVPTKFSSPSVDGPAGFSKPSPGERRPPKYCSDSSDNFSVFANDCNKLETIGIFAGSNEPGESLCTYVAGGEGAPEPAGAKRCEEPDRDGAENRDYSGVSAGREESKQISVQGNQIYEESDQIYKSAAGSSDDSDEACKVKSCGGIDEKFGDACGKSREIGGDISGKSHEIGGDVSGKSHEIGGDVSGKSHEIGGDVSGKSSDIYAEFDLINNEFDRINNEFDRINAESDEIRRKSEDAIHTKTDTDEITEKSAEICKESVKIYEKSAEIYKESVKTYEKSAEICKDSVITSGDIGIESVITSKKSDVTSSNSHEYVHRNSDDVSKSEIQSNQTGEQPDEISISLKPDISDNADGQSITAGLKSDEVCEEFSRIDEKSGKIYGIYLNTYDEIRRGPKKIGLCNLKRQFSDDFDVDALNSFLATEFSDEKTLKRTKFLDNLQFSDNSQVKCAENTKFSNNPNKASENNKICNDSDKKKLNCTIFLDNSSDKFSNNSTDKFSDNSNNSLDDSEFVLNNSFNKFSNEIDFLDNSTAKFSDNSNNSLDDSEKCLNYPKFLDNSTAKFSDNTNNSLDDSEKCWNYPKILDNSTAKFSDNTNNSLDDSEKCLNYPKFLDNSRDNISNKVKCSDYSTIKFSDNSNSSLDDSECFLDNSSNEFLNEVKFLDNSTVKYADNTKYSDNSNKLFTDDNVFDNSNKSFDYTKFCDNFNNTFLDYSKYVDNFAPSGNIKSESNESSDVTNNSNAQILDNTDYKLSGDSSTKAAGNEKPEDNLSHKFPGGPENTGGGQSKPSDQLDLNDSKDDLDTNSSDSDKPDTRKSAKNYEIDNKSPDSYNSHEHVRTVNTSTKSHEFLNKSSDYYNSHENINNMLIFKQIINKSINNLAAPTTYNNSRKDTPSSSDCYYNSRRDKKSVNNLLTDDNKPVSNLAMSKSSDSYYNSGKNRKPLPSSSDCSDKSFNNATKDYGDPPPDCENPRDFGSRGHNNPQEDANESSTNKSRQNEGALQVREPTTSQNRLIQFKSDQPTGIKASESHNAPQQLYDFAGAAAPKICADADQDDAGSGNSEAETYESCSENVSERRASRDEASDVSLNQSERPSSLDIATQGDCKREINLIGNPGSTPYNNLYVSKEIPTDKPKQAGHYESESSASVSPTFSEASTDSVRSTDSTDSEGEPAKEAPGGSAEGGAEGGVGEEAGSAAGGSGAEDTTSEDTVKAEAGSEEGADIAGATEIPESEVWLGKRAPVWIPDSDALNCLHCDMKFTVIKRRHHCRACGLVLCSKCCSLKHRLEYLDMEARVCTRCHEILSRDGGNSSSGSEVSPAAGNSPSVQPGQPNPNNPMEYCSVVPPLQQALGPGDNPPSVMVPVGVLKRKGSNKAKHNKSVMFCDGIRPGSDLTNLDNDFNYNETRSTSSSSSSSSKKPPAAPKANRNVPSVDPGTKSFIPENENCLPPTVTTFKSDTTYTECANNANVVEMLKNETLTFALQRNLHVHVRLITMECCINKQTWCFSTEGLIHVGQDEIVVLLEYIDNERVVPKDVFYHLNNIYNDAVKGNTVTELGLSMHPTTNFLDSKNHAGFIYIRPTFQCLKNVIVPKEPYLVGILVHRWETPWAKIFPLRLVLRLGAEYRYYPSPVISTRHRDSVFVEIGHTIINLLADFRNFSYTLPSIRGLTIHMEGKNTTVTIPANRYDQVMKSISNSSDHILAFGGNFSMGTDSHLVCIQDVHGNNENNYTTHAINIQNKPRKVTGASFIVFNGALKSSSGLTAKSSIVEDGLMIQIPADQMVQVRESLRNMKNHTIQCGCVNATSDETVNVIWGGPDVNFNVGVKSSVDEQPLSGVPSIRVHNGKDYVCNSGNRLIRWTEVFLLQNGEENARTQDPVDISKVAESISKATSQALVKYLDLLATNNFYKIGIRTTLHVENVSYSAGSNGIKLPPIYMKSLDNELVPVLHRITSNNFGDNVIVLELIFRILNV